MTFDCLLLISANSIKSNVTKKIKAFCNYKSFERRDKKKEVTCIVPDENQEKRGFLRKKKLLIGEIKNV